MDLTSSQISDDQSQMSGSQMSGSGHPGLGVQGHVALASSCASINQVSKPKALQGAIAH